MVGDRTQASPGARRVQGLLPAYRVVRERQDRRGRGAATLGAPAAGAATARGISLCRRGYWHDLTDRGRGASRSLSPAAGVATTLPRPTALDGEREPLPEAIVPP